jgi:hypothetical protein
MFTLRFNFCIEQKRKIYSFHGFRNIGMSSKWFSLNLSHLNLIDQTKFICYILYKNLLITSLTVNVILSDL